MRPVEFTHLSELALSKFLFSATRTSYDVETMIVSNPVATTLRKLVLTHCAIIVSTTGGGDRAWADVLTGFRLKVTRLRRIEVQKMGYKWNAPDGPRRFSKEQHVYRADAEALVALWEGIGQVQGFGLGRLVHYFD